MSVLSKVFVVFIFVLSVAFFGTSATLFKMRQDWKQAYQQSKKEMQADLGKLKDHNAELLKQNDEQHTTIIQGQSREDQLAKELKQKVEDLKEEKQKVQKANSEQARANSVSEQLARTVEAEKASNQQLQDALTKVKADLTTALDTTAQANKEKASMTLDLAKVQQDLHAAQVELKELTDLNDTQKIVIARYTSKFGALGTGVDLAPPIDALVNAVDAKEKLVVLSAGKDQKVESGYEFTVYRGDEFIGKVKVIKVYPNLAGARILFTKEGAEIQRGDKAKTSSSL